MIWVLRALSTVPFRGSVPSPHHVISITVILTYAGSVAPRRDGSYEYRRRFFFLLSKDH